MAFVVANHHPDVMAQDNAAAVGGAAMAAAQAKPMSEFARAYQDINEDKEPIG